MTYIDKLNCLRDAAKRKIDLYNDMACDANSKSQYEEERFYLQKMYALGAALAYEDAIHEYRYFFGDC